MQCSCVHAFMLGFLNPISFGLAECSDGVCWTILANSAFLPGAKQVTALPRRSGPFSHPLFFLFPTYSRSFSRNFRFSFSSTSGKSRLNRMWRPGQHLFSLRPRQNGLLVNYRRKCSFTHILPPSSFSLLFPSLSLCRFHLS